MEQVAATVCRRANQRVDFQATLVMPVDSNQIKSWAREIGFDQTGIAQCGMAPNGERFINWLERGGHRGMRWILRDAYRRLDPRCLVAGAQSIICLAVNYYTPHDYRPEELKISRYAWGTDYHQLLGEKLTKLVARIGQAEPEAQLKWYVDTGPVLEKEWAQQAGLGWIGKNNILINREFGSWLFLGEIITTLVLKPDKPEQDHCGDCDLCLTACPTGALTAARVLDPQRCISYWTIEHQDDFVEETPDSMAGWVFGCDECQSVCPHNCSPQTSNHGEQFAPREELLRATRWQDLDQDEFRRLTKGSALQRAGLAGIQRNIQAAHQQAANRQQPSDQPQTSSGKKLLAGR